MLNDTLMMMLLLTECSIILPEYRRPLHAQATRARYVLLSACIMLHDPLSISGVHYFAVFVLYLILDRNVQ